MKQSHKFAVGVIASLGLGIAAAAVYAQPGPMGGGMGPQHGMQHGAQGGMQHGAMGGMQHGNMGGAQHGNMGGMEHGGMGSSAVGRGAGQQLMTPEERTALREKMHNAKTPEERRQIAAANHAEMQKRAQENGFVMPGHRGPRTGGPSAGTAPQAPATTE